MSSFEDSIQAYRDKVYSLYSKVSDIEIQKLVDTILGVIRNGKTIYVLGNGGSASTASHFVTDLNNIKKRCNINIKAHSLVDNTSIITAIANDNSFEHIFENQLTNRVDVGDLVLSISASGNSPNLINAVSYSNSVGAISASLLGFDGGTLKTISTIFCHINSAQNAYGPVEDIHLSICHYLALRIESYYEK